MKGKMKLGILIISSFMFVFMLIGCDPSSKNKMEFYESTDSVDLSKENVNTITLDSKENDVINTFGKPNEVKEIKNPLSKYFTYDGMEFGIIEGRVFRYYFTENYQTSKGITIGDSKEKVIKGYGEKYYERVESGINTVGYFDKENMINIEFGFDDNKVIGAVIEKFEWKDNK